MEEDVPAGELAERVGTLPFDEPVTRLHTAIGQALDYFEGMPWERNELRCMVILSDTSGETQVNGEKLQKPQRLRSGDEITAGSAVIRLKF